MAADTPVPPEKHLDDLAVAHQWGANLAREVYVFGAGTVLGAVKEGLKEASEDPVATGERLAGALATGAILGYLQRGEKLGTLAAEGLAVGGTLSMAADIPQKWDAICTVARDTWAHPENTEENIDALQQSLGRFGFDLAAASLVAMAGTTAGGRLGLNKPYIPDFTTDGFLPPGEHTATWEEFQSRYGFTPARRQILKQVQPALQEIQNAGGSHVYFGGGFVTSKLKPHDIDGVWLSKETGTDWAPLNAKIMDMDRGQRLDLYADNEWMGSQRKGKEFFKFNDRSGKRVGIVGVDLSTLPKTKS